MKKLGFAVAAMVAISVGMIGTALAITENQGKVIPVLESLKLEPVKSKVIGGPQKFKVTKDTLDFLEKAMKDGKVIILESDGTIKIEKDKGDAGDK